MGKMLWPGSHNRSQAHQNTQQPTQTEQHINTNTNTNTSVKLQY
jgi:hypothetical protein